MPGTGAEHFRIIPRKMCLVSGAGVHESRLVSFELALREAGINDFNLVPVSSIVPKNCVLVEREELVRDFSPGEVVFCVLARACTSERAVCYASVACALHRNAHGYISEVSGVVENGRTVQPGKEAESLAREMFASRHGFEPELLRSAEVLRTCEGEGKYLTVISAAVFSLR